MQEISPHIMITNTPQIGPRRILISQPLNEQEDSLLTILENQQLILARLDKLQATLDRPNVFRRMWAWIKRLCGNR